MKRPDKAWVVSRLNSWEYHHEATSDLEGTELAQGWRRQHASAVINAMVSTLAFVHVAERAKLSLDSWAAGVALRTGHLTLGELLDLDLGKDGVQEP
jgi:hypothetical protein